MSNNMEEVQETGSLNYKWSNLKKKKEMSNNTQRRQREGMEESLTEIVNPNLMLRPQMVSAEHQRNPPTPLS